MPYNTDDLSRLLVEIDGRADDAAGLIKSLPEESAEIEVELALDRLNSRWGSDKAEFVARRQWLRSEILRRLPKIGRA